jgi:hypothetical protein
MTDNEDEPAKVEAEGDTVSVEGTTTVSATSCGTVTVLRSLDSIREDIEDGDLGIAFVQLSVRVERELHERLDSHIDKIDSELRLTGFVKDETGLRNDDHGLGWYVSNANRVGLVDKEYRGTLDKLAEERNKLVHETGYVGELRSGESKREEVKQMLLGTIDFLDDAGQ